MTTNATSSKRADPFRGMMPILPTTILPDGRIDEASQRRLVRYCLDCGAVAIGHFGFASEFFKLTATDRRLITELVVEETAGKVPVFLGVTATSPRLAVELAREAEDLGADMLMVATPYVAVPDQAGLYDHFLQISRASKLPIIIQDTPLAAATLTAEFCVRMFNEIETVLYCKAEGTDFLSKAKRLRELTDDRMHVIGGFGGKHLIHNLRLGVTSYMTGTEMLDLHGTIVRTFLAGDQEAAAKMYFEKLLPYFVFYDAYPEELLKRMLHSRGVIDHPDAIPPRASKPMGQAEMEEFDWVLQRIGFYNGVGKMGLDKTLTTEQTRP